VELAGDGRGKTRRWKGGRSGRCMHRVCRGLCTQLQSKQERRGSHELSVRSFIHGVRCELHKAFPTQCYSECSYIDVFCYQIAYDRLHMPHSSAAVRKPQLHPNHCKCNLPCQALSNHPYPPSPSHLLHPYTHLKQNYPSDPPKYPPTQQNSENATACASPHRTPAGHPSSPPTASSPHSQSYCP